jgi:hypothetical protein
MELTNKTLFHFLLMSSLKLLKYVIIFLVWFGSQEIGFAQEIDASVHVDLSQINSSSFHYLHDLAGKFQSYLNDYSWTSDKFRAPERIRADFQITLLSADDDHTFHADLVIRSLRPIYNTGRQSTTFLYHDKNWTFHYTPNSDLIHDKLQFNDIATLLDFYAYLIIGYDYDTFSPLGGSSYFSEAQHLVSLAQTTSAKGWERTGSHPKNRARLASSLLDPNYKPLRKASYIYYRKGLDLFLKSQQQARKNILKALQLVQKAEHQTTNSLLFDIFFNTKAEELTSIFKDAPTHIRLKAFNLLSDLDPSHLPIYNGLQ